jgi:hypothetical protein
MYRLIETVLAEIGPRESCSENERRLGRHLAQLWSTLGYEVRSERFTCHPKAFLGFIPFAALLYLAATVVYWVFPPACFVLAAVAAAMIFFELVRYREFVDRLFPAAEGENVIAIIRPRGEVRQRVIVSAHQDSAYEVNLWFLLQNAAVPIMLLGFAAVFVPLLGGLAKSVAGAAAGHRAFDVIGYVCIALYPFVGLNLFFHTYVLVPGAMDNLAGISVLAGVGQALADARQTLRCRSSRGAACPPVVRPVRRRHLRRGLPDRGQPGALHQRTARCAPDRAGHRRRCASRLADA